MVLDIQLFRKDQGGDPQLVIESQKRRYADEKAVQAVIDKDDEWKKADHDVSRFGKRRNDLIKEIGQKMKNKEDATELKKEKEEVEKQIAEAEKRREELDVERTKLLGPIGNLVHESVPVSKDEDNNAIVAQWGELKTESTFKHHHELLYLIDGYDAPRGVNVAGHRAYFLRGVGVQLNYAIQQYGMDFLRRRKYTLLQPPYFMKKDVMANTAQLEQFDEELYKVVGGAQDEEKEKYLIATSEQPISALHMNEWLEPKQLPIRYGGISTCFRKEAGAHGKDNWGIFRVHQFEKVEQFCITAPGEDSWKMHEEMLQISKDFYQSLGIPYRVVSIVSGALNNAAAKKYDLEGWFPGFHGKDKDGKDINGEFRELVSCSNCTDYQSRNMGIRYGTTSQNAKEKKFVHLLNSTLCATTRTICVILENYQTEKGVKVPEVLRPYMDGLEFMEFVHTELKVSKGAKGQAKADNKKPKEATKEEHK
eukprot:TRINITY_DN970_c0_g1_i1.p1 TRINITY_DN970_c0_g1~~TRINITY_DN970_c0_g1_i1.p1  ORF type:complete len:479 (-),score=194.71 TRINITY_DN970_c0_g1_i1:43-1479(-)